MTAKDELERHKKDCPRCIESAPNLWNLCEEGQALLRRVPISELDDDSEEALDK
jgi:hypothetical protein